MNIHKGDGERISITLIVHRKQKKDLRTLEVFFRKVEYYLGSTSIPIALNVSYTVILAPLFKTGQPLARATAASSESAFG